MNQSRYRLALREFYAALAYFSASGLREEYANTCDNMGRVYALLYQRDQAERLVDNGLELRVEREPDYRVALSLNSRAIAHLIFGEPHRAHRLSIEALSIFERLSAQRGIGLACITQGRALRHLGSFGRTYSHEKRITFLEQAAMYLSRAIEIFDQHVCEPVRLIEAHNELGCTYRDGADLSRRMDPDSEQVGRYNDIAVQHLRKAIKLAEKENFMLLCVDSCEDLARTYLQNGKFDAAERWLQYAGSIIPDNYKSRESSGLRDIPIEECIEEFWYQMGKIELSRGHLAFKRGTSDNGGVPHEVLKQATQHRASAIAYFDHHKKQTAEARTYFQ
jgi:tetratricopeptide (TPR) repeat protein